MIVEDRAVFLPNEELLKKTMEIKNDYHLEYKKVYIYKCDNSTALDRVRKHCRDKKIMIRIMENGYIITYSEIEEKWSDVQEAIKAVELTYTINNLIYL